MSLHKDRFPTLDAENVDAGAVRRVIVVDVRRASRLGHVSVLRDRILARDPGLEVHVWDHHGAAEDDIPAHFERIERVGSVTTLFVEEIQERDVGVDHVEATLFALGIHVDTGSLRHSGTTSRDAAALAWLLGRGARLSVINRYLEQPFSDGQRHALSALLGAIQVERIGSARVGVARLPEGSGVDGLDEVTSEALALENVHALIASFGLRGGRAQIVARSRVPWLDVGKALQTVGGGGHPAAGAAVIREGNGDAEVDAVLAVLRSAAPRPLYVRDIMSGPVRSVHPNALVKILRDSLASWGHTGAPVMKDGKLIGVISRRDVESAVENGREGERVSRHMSQPVHTTEEDSSLDDALARMTSADVGRLLVVRGDSVVGIVTRRDVIEALYE
jgi:tRNA nucleotidyltransferase (CCA-adding enzyme)